MSERVAFCVRGEPKGKGRARAVASIIWRGGIPEAVVRLVTPKDTRRAEKALRDVFRARYPDHRLWHGPIMLRFTAVFETPASFNRALQAAAARQELYAVKKPDKDNIEKLIVDALNGIAFADDAQIMGGGVKRYGSPARLDIILEKLGEAHIPATPGQIRTERRMVAENHSQPQFQLSRLPTKSRKKHPPALQVRIDAALARDAK